MDSVVIFLSFKKSFFFFSFFFQLKHFSRIYPYHQYEKSYCTSFARLSQSALQSLLYKLLILVTKEEEDEEETLSII